MSTFSRMSVGAPMWVMKKALRCMLYTTSSKDELHPNCCISFSDTEISKNGSSGRKWPLPGHPVPGPLPITGKTGQGLQALPHHRQRLLLLHGIQRRNNACAYHQEKEGKPFFLLWRGSPGEGASSLPGKGWKWLPLRNSSWCGIHSATAAEGSFPLWSMWLRF